MNKNDTEDLEAFLIEAELVNQKVKALAENRISVEEFDVMEKKKHQQIGKKQQQKKVKQQKMEQEMEQARINGRPGKGITKDFTSFCRSCHHEYELETSECLKCGKATMTLSQRQKQLQQMVQNYKQKKSKKEARRQKWDMWKKTQSMLPSKLATQYTKWQAYTSSQQQPQNQQPIVPKDDPNFKALEMDLQQRKKRKQESDKKSNAYKEKGNKLMQEMKYQEAADCYSLALEESRDNKLVYTNRALAYIRLKKWQRAIKDCTTVIQYMECFEKLEECPDLAFKGFSRRALAHKERKQYSKALEDITQALKYNSKDEAGLRLKTEIENFIKFEKESNELMKDAPESKEEEEKEYSEKEIVKELAQEQIKSTVAQTVVEEVKAEKSTVPTQPVEKIKYYLENISSDSSQKLLKLLISEPNLKSVFIKLEGIKTLLAYIQKQQDKGKAVVLLSYLMDGNGIAEQEVWNSNPHLFQQRCTQILHSQLKTDSYSELEDYFEIFVALSLNEKYRLLLADSTQTISFIKQCYPILITKYKKEPEVLNSYIVYFSNLLKGETKIKHSIAQNIKPILESLHKILSVETKNTKIHELQKSIYILLSNLCTNATIRAEVTSQISILETAANHLRSFPKSSEVYEPFIQAVLSVFVNVLFQANPAILQTISKLNIETTLYDRFICNNTIINQALLRAMNIFSKLDFKTKEVPKKWISKMEGFFTEDNIQKGVANHALRFYNNVYLNHPQLDLPAKLDPIFHLINSQNQILFCNSCNLFGIWGDNPKLSPTIFPHLRAYIPKLIHIAKQKTGNLRKSAAILLAKIARDQGSREIFQAHHGMDVIKSIASFVLDKK